MAYGYGYSNNWSKAGMKKASTPKAKKVEERWPFGEVVAVALLVVDTHGWVSTKDAVLGAQSTASRVKDALVKGEVATPDLIVSDEWKARYEKAEVIRQWCRALPSKVYNEYEDKLRSLSWAGTAEAPVVPWVSAKDVGIAASAVSAYNRAMERAAANEAKAANSPYSGHVGAEGDSFGLKKKGSLPALIGSFVSHRPTQFGAAMEFEVEGKLVIVFGDGVGCGWKPGDKFTIKGSVKSAGQYKGVDQTVLTRSSVTKVLS